MTDGSQDRRSYIGGPGAATIAGVNKWQTPLELYLYLTGRDGGITEVNSAMRAGLLLEPAVLAYAAEELGQRILPGPFVRLPDAPLGGHLDGVVDGQPEIIEAKTARSRDGFGEPGTDEIPPQYLAQIQHYFGLMPGARVCWVPVLFANGGFQFEMYRVERDEAIVRELQRRCVEWWHDHVERDLPPAPRNGSDAAKLFPRETLERAEADDATVEAWHELVGLRRAAKDLDERREALEARLKLALGPAAVLGYGDQVLATWKTAKPAARFDAARFKVEQPEVYAQFCSPVASRRFLVKGEAA